VWDVKRKGAGELGDLAGDLGIGGPALSGIDESEVRRLSGDGKTLALARHDEQKIDAFGGKSHARPGA
jgi:hypothetical protein